MKYSANEKRMKSISVQYRYFIENFSNVKPIFIQHCQLEIFLIKLKYFTNIGFRFEKYQCERNIFAMEGSFPMKRQYWFYFYTG